MVSVLGSPILHLFSPSATIRTLHDATTDLDGLTADCASEAESKEYYDSLNQHEDEEEAELGGTAAGLVDAYCASPPSEKWKQQREQRRESRAEAEADEKVEEDDEEQTRAMLEELQTAHDERPATADKHSTSSERTSKRQMAAGHALTATRATRGSDTQSAEPAATVGKHVTSSMFATTSSGSKQSKQATGNSNKGGKQKQKADASDKLAEDGAIPEKEQKEEEKAARRSTRRTVEPKQPMAAADGADLFYFGGAEANEIDKHEGRQQGVSKKKGKKAVAAAEGSKKGAKRKAVSGRAAPTKKVTAEEQTEQLVTDTAALNEFDGESVRQNARRALPALSTARQAPAEASADRNSAAAEDEEQLEQDSHVFSFPSVADEKKKKGHATTTAACKKQASAGRKKGKASQRAKRDDEQGELPAEGEAVLDEMVDGGDTALGRTAVSSTAHLDGYTASPPSARWQKKRAGERLREIDQRAQQDDQSEDMDDQPQADTNGDGSNQQTEVEQLALERAEADKQSAVAAKSRKAGKITPVAKGKRDGSVAAKKKGGASKRAKKFAEQQLLRDDGQADEERTEQQEQTAEGQEFEGDAQQVIQGGQLVEDNDQYQPVSDTVTELEEEQAQETDLYQFSSDGAKKQPKTAKRATTATKQGKRAVNKTASKASKKTNAAARRKRKRQDGAAADLSDVFDAVGREIGLIHASDDDNTQASTAVEAPTVYEMENEPVEPTTFTRPAKKRRSSRPQARAPTALFVDSTATMSPVPVSDAVMASTVAGYCQAVSADVQDTAERAHNAYKQHAKAADTIIAALAKSAHTNYSPLST